MLSSVAAYLSKKSRIWIVGNCIVIALLLGFVDYWTGYDRSLSAFYLIPVLVSTWYISVQAGILVALITVLSTTVSGIMTPYLPDKYFTLYWNASIRTIFFIISILILNAWKNERFYARIDHLTGLSNRYNFSEILYVEIERCKRFKHPLSLVYMDVDNFKTINDRFGHRAGDELLKLTAKSLSDNFRAVDIVARLGGDEFIILMPGMSSEEVEDRIRTVRNNLMKVMNMKNWPATFSFGIAVFTNCNFTPNDMVNIADLLMYKAKQNGKDSMVVQTYP